jgi:hypothetical protein
VEGVFGDSVPGAFAYTGKKKFTAKEKKSKKEVKKGLSYQNFFDFAVKISSNFEIQRLAPLHFPPIGGSIELFRLMAGNKTGGRPEGAQRRCNYEPACRCFRYSR